MQYMKKRILPIIFVAFAVIIIATILIISSMKNKNYKNYEISDMLGYSTVDYFSKIFKEMTGVTPTQFRTHNE